MGNTFDVNTVKYGHARKVWREIRHRYPGGGMVSNISDWVAVGKIPAGTAVKFDLSGKTFKAYTDEQIKAAESDITTLGINGYLQEDVLVASENTKASGTIWLALGHPYPLACNASRSVRLILARCSRWSCILASFRTINSVQAILVGGNAVVKMRVRIRLTRYSRIVRQQAMYAPADAAALPKVPTRKSISRMHPVSSAQPRPRGPLTPNAWASST